MNFITKLTSMNEFFFANEFHSAEIVIPCYNEAHRLPVDEFESFMMQNPGIQFLFVNDGSTDHTLEVITALSERFHGQARVLDLQKNSGKAEAVRCGLLKAVASGAEYVGYWDADLATPLYTINDFLRVAYHNQELDMIFGARRSMLGHNIERTRIRRLVTRGCALLAQMAVRLPVTDTQTGAKIFRNTIHLHRALVTKFTAGWLFDVEIFTRLARELNAAHLTANKKFFEYPLAEWHEIPGSKINTSDIMQSLLIMMRLIARDRYF